MGSVTISSIIIPGWQRSGSDVELRIYVDEDYLASDGTLVVAGNPGNNLVYKTFVCTINTTLKTNTISAGSLFSTTDGRDRQTSRYSAYFFSTTTNSIIEPFLLQFKLSPTPSTQTWEDIITFNSLGAPIPRDFDTFSKTQILQLIQDLADSMMVGGIVQPAFGGTGLDASATGGAARVVFQESVGGAFSVRALVDADIPDTITASNYILLTQKAAANGVATLDSGTKIPVAQLPNGLGNTNFTGPTQLRSYALPDADAVIAAGAATLGAVLVGTGSTFSSTTTPSIGGLTTNLQAALVVGPYGASAGNTGEIRLLELAANGTHYLGQKAPDSLAASRVVVWPSSDPTSGQVLTAGAPSGGVITLSWSTPAAPAGGYNLIQVDGSSLPQDTTLNFLGATAAGAIGGVGPFVGDQSGAVERIAIRTSPDNSTVLVGTTRALTVSGGPLTIGGGASADLSADRDIAVLTSPVGATAVVGITRELAVSGGPLTIAGGASADLSANRTIAISVSPAASPTLVGTGRLLTSAGTITIGGSGSADLSANRALEVVANTTVQKVAARKNSTGGDVGTRRRINFIEGSNITLTVADDAGDDELDVTIAASGLSDAHDFLSMTHSDTLAHTLVGGDRGSIIAVNSTPAYAILTPSTPNRVVLWNGTDTVFAQVNLTSMVTGTLPLSGGGTGQTTAAAAFDALSPMSANGDLITRAAGTAARLALGAALQGLRVNAAGTALEYADITATAATNAGTTNDAQAFAFIPSGYEDLGGGGAIAFSTAVTTTALTQVNRAYGARFYLPQKIRFTHLATRYLSAVAGVQYSVAVYSADGSDRKVYSGVFTTGAAAKNFISAASGADAVISGSAVSGGIATLDAGHYLLGWTVAASTSVNLVGITIATTAGLSNLFAVGSETGATETNSSMTGEITTTSAGAMPAGATSFTGRNGSASQTIPLVKLYTA